MNGWKEILLEYPVLQTILDILYVVIPFSMLLAFAGILFISSAAKILSITRKRAAFDKCSRQLALLGLILGWLLLIGSRVWLYYTQDESLKGTFINFMLETSWLLLSMGVLLSSIYFTLWRILKNMPTLHSTIGIISACQNCLALVSAMVTTRMFVLIKPDKDVLTPDLFPDAWNDPLWTAACITLPLIFAMAGAYGAAWLPLRRKQDDFGRDYYNQMIPWVTGWAKNCWLILWLLLLFSAGIQIWQSYEAGPLDKEAMIAVLIQLLFWIIPFLLWTFVHSKKIPIRYKYVLYLAFILAISYALPYFLEISSITPTLSLSE